MTLALVAAVAAIDAQAKVLEARIAEQLGQHPDGALFRGLVGAALGIVPALGGMFGVLVAPLALQEMVMAVWLIAKGFNSPTIAAQSASETSRWRAVAPSTVPTT